MTKSKRAVPDTAIASLGPARIATPLRHPRYVDETSPLKLILTSEELSELGNETMMLSFEKAGPRQRLYFDPPKTKCAIVTCGGLCPGINDVIRAIVMESHYHYGIRTVLGIRNGLRGFIPQIWL